MTTSLAFSLVALLGVGFVGIGGVRSLRDAREPTASSLLVVGVVCLSVAAVGTVPTRVLGAPSASAILAAVALAGLVGLGVGTLRDDSRLATTGYWLGSAGFALPVAFVGHDITTVVAAVSATLLFAGLYGVAAKQSPARTVTVGANQ